MADPSGLQQSFQQNLESSAEIAADMNRCKSEMTDLMFRTKAVLAASRELIANVNKLLAR